MTFPDRKLIIAHHVVAHVSPMAHPETVRALEAMAAALEENPHANPFAAGYGHFGGLVGGRSRSAEKVRAARKNGTRGGRPKEEKP